MTLLCAKDSGNWQTESDLRLPRRDQIGFLYAVPNKRSFVKYWLPVLFWMGCIFFASTDTLSSPRTSRFLGPLLRRLFPLLSDETVDLLVFGIRKCAHLTEFAVLGLLFWRALRKPVRHDPRPWSWTQARLALLCVVLYASSDEFHQLFVPSREAALGDVLIDTIGGAAGLLALWLVRRWRKKW